MIQFKEGDTDNQRGTWKSWQIEDGPRLAIISCPDCGLSGTLRTHKVADDGKVTPSIVCPHEGCGFHDWGLLVGWKA